ncbi:uncharacterized protein LOC115794060 [Archocentrus centrarchus]|uniref:uncharacterized protein LOC115794060 n=1 Tax=Archocentrus centrarchus TaxID=63155 RepID=UPI0011EA4F3B|nr:uncharacterized protein LOC115794060 [Archocentrus centrarchus]
MANSPRTRYRDILKYTGFDIRAIRADKPAVFTDICHLRATGTTTEFCCVPLCPLSSRYNRVLSFFFHEDIQEPASETGRRCLKKGAVPALFERNNYSVPLPRPGVWERRQRPPPEGSEEEDNIPTNATGDVLKEHDYASSLDPAVVDLVLEENNALRDEIRQLREQIESLMLRQRFGIHRFAASDKDIRFFTRFASYDLLMRFWAMIEPALPSMVSVCQGQRGTLRDSTHSTH